jgi:tripartite-type tricarboxylate transporter receptor subunit TctC
MKQLKTLLTTLCVGALVLAAATPAAAAEWTPTKPIRLIVPYAPGAFGDVSARILMDRVSQALGQPIVIDNRVGASGSIGTEAGAHAAPDGYTWTLGADPGMTIFPHMQKVNYDVSKDFIPVSLVAVTPLVLVTNSSLPVHTFPELVALAKSKPGKLTMGSSGNGTPPHLTAELFRAAGIDVLHIPFKGQAQAMTDLLGGRIDMTVSSLSASSEFVKAGRVKVLALSSAARSRLMPDVPTFREMGYPDFEFRTWVGILVPTGTPKDVTQRIQAEVAKALSLKDVRDRFAGLAYEDPDTSPDALKEIIQANNTRFGALIRRSGIKAE